MEEKKPIKWVNVENKKQTLMMYALQYKLIKPEKMTTENLVDTINHAIAKKNGVEVPEELLVNKPKAKVVNPNATTTRQPRKPREVNSKPKVEVVPVAINIEGALVVTISGRTIGGKTILANRRMLVTGTKNESLIGHLIDKAGNPQKSEITMPPECTDYLEVTKVKVEKELEAIAL